MPAQAFYDYFSEISGFALDKQEENVYNINVLAKCRYGEVSKWS